MPPVKLPTGLIPLSGPNPYLRRDADDLLPARGTPRLYDKMLGRELIALLDGEEVDGPPFAKTRFRGSPNQKALWMALYFGWAQRRGSPAQQADALAGALDFLAEQERCGHMTAADGRANEQTTASHWHQWGLAMAALEVFALENAQRGGGYAELLAASHRWWRGEVALLALGETPSGAIVLPGTRSEPGRYRDAIRDAAYDLLVHGKPVAFKHRAIDTEPVFLIAQLLARGYDFGGAGRATRQDLPVLRSPLHVERWADGHVAWYDRLDDALDPVLWAAARYDTGEEWYGNRRPPRRFRPAGAPLERVTVRRAPER